LILLLYQGAFGKRYWGHVSTQDAHQPQYPISRPDPGVASSLGL